MKNVYCFFIVLLFTISLFTGSFAQELPKTGEPAPEINVTEWIQGKTEFQGKTVFLTFFESWCGNCRRIEKQINRLTGKYGSDDFIFIYLSSEPLDRLKRYVKRVKLDPLIVHDDGDTSIKSYGVKIIPESFIINKAGILVWRGHPGRLVDKHFDDYLATGKTPSGVFRGPV